MSIPLMKNC